MSSPSASKPYDSFGKELLSKTFSPWGHVEIQHELTTPPLFADILFEPSGALPPSTPLLSLLWRLGQGPTLLEVFSDTPSLNDCLDIVEKALRAHRNRRPARTADDPDYVRPFTWILSPGRPEQTIKTLRLTRASGWPRGILSAPAALQVGVVVVGELPRTPSTLILRLFGHRGVQLRALTELATIDTNAITTLIAETYTRWYTVMPKPTRPFLDTSDPELMEVAERLYQKYMKDFADDAARKGYDAGIEKGIEKGTLAPLVHQFGRRLGRPLTAEERDGLSQRLAALGADRLSDVVLDIADAAALEAWLHDPNAR